MNISRCLFLCQSCHGYSASPTLLSWGDWNYTTIHKPRLISLCRKQKEKTIRRSGTRKKTTETFLLSCRRRSLSLSGAESWLVLVAELSHTLPLFFINDVLETCRHSVPSGSDCGEVAVLSNTDWDIEREKLYLVYEKETCFVMSLKWQMNALWNSTRRNHQEDARPQRKKTILMEWRFLWLVLWHFLPQLSLWRAPVEKARDRIPLKLVGLDVLCSVYCFVVFCFFTLVLRYVFECICLHLFFSYFVFNIL